MSIYRDLWTAGKALIDGNTALQAFFTGGVIYGTHEHVFASFPALVVDLGDPPVTEKYFQLPRRKVGFMKWTFYAKVQNTNLETLFLNTYQAIEVVLNALDIDLSWGGRLLQITLMDAEDAIKISSKGDINDVKFNIILQTQPFIAGNR
jgi:hypothetical protein